MLSTIPCLARTAKRFPKRLSVTAAIRATVVGRRYAGSAAPAAKKVQSTDTKNESSPEIRKSPTYEAESQRTLPVTNEPFAKNLFLGKFDKVP